VFIHFSEASLVNPFHLQKQFQADNSQYRGRFAPSPSGPLHFGSLVAALGSFLHAKSQSGLWFVRIEDIDKPREQVGSVDDILDALTSFGMIWDQDLQTPDDNNYRGCVVQSKRLARYQQIFEQLQQQELLYTCYCTRKDIKQMGGSYLGHCRDKQHQFDGHAVRIKQTPGKAEFVDLLHGKVTVDDHLINEDYIVKRSDGLFAYQLVVVVDDIDQGITNVVRGADIMELTPRQVSLFNLFEITPPTYLHLPLIINENGQKLSKQNKAPAINCNNPKPELLKALSCLGLPTNEQSLLGSATVAEIIDWAIQNWDINKVPAQLDILI
jgi:glutamyl-Q tRNA(Asp) synthetase